MSANDENREEYELEEIEDFIPAIPGGLDDWESVSFDNQGKPLPSTAVLRQKLAKVEEFEQKYQSYLDLLREEAQSWKYRILYSSTMRTSIAFHEDLLIKLRASKQNLETQIEQLEERERKGRDSLAEFIDQKRTAPVSFEVLPAERTYFYLPDHGDTLTLQFTDELAKEFEAYSEYDGSPGSRFYAGNDLCASFVQHQMISGQESLQVKVVAGFQYWTVELEDESIIRLIDNQEGELEVDAPIFGSPVLTEGVIQDGTAWRIHMDNFSDLSHWDIDAFDIKRIIADPSNTQD